MFHVDLSCEGMLKNRRHEDKHALHHQVSAASTKSDACDSEKHARSVLKASPRNHLAASGGQSLFPPLVRDKPLAPRVASENAPKTQDVPHQLAGLDLLTVQLHGCILPALVGIGVRNEVAVVEDCPRVEEVRRRHIGGAMGTSGHGSHRGA